jgi:hypothetical protein
MAFPSGSAHTRVMKSPWLLAGLVVAVTALAGWTPRCAMELLA